MRLLLVEDNSRLTSLLSEFLSQRGFALDCAGSLRQAEDHISTISYDAIILDLGLPDGDGTQLLSVLRKTGNQTPVLILTARDSVEDKVAGLNLGADDYLLKPFHNHELEARLRALLRRPNVILQQTLKLGLLELDTHDRNLTVRGQTVELGKREIDVLEVLLRRAGHIMTRSALSEAVHNANDSVSENAIEVCIHRLRKKLEPMESQCQILTIRGIGYMIKEKETS